ncbi:MAG: tRNA pseudouridine(55) synthase TruB [Firmicutes bacterium]|nr:tRNA pseudouridine(55) synthase TruB [Bacillota bacterium]
MADKDISGVVNLVKDRGFTSHDAVAAVRKIFGGVKAGHAGTLDPEAEGVLPVCLGKATKIADYIGGESKSYRGVLVLGKTTDTQDLTGGVLSERGFAWDSRAVEKAVRSFEGEICQIPPMYSAVKVNGQKLYQMARRGLEIEREARRVTIYRIGVVSEDPETNTAVIDVDCSRGTYIRTLFADIGERLGCGGCMGALTRTSVGAYRIEDGVTVGRLREMAGSGGLDAVVQPVESALPYPPVDVLQEAEKKLRNGNPIPTAACDMKGFEAVPGRVFLVRADGRTAGIFEVCGGESGGFTLKPRVMLL